MVHRKETWEPLEEWKVFDICMLTCSFLEVKLLMKKNEAWLAGLEAKNEKNLIILEVCTRWRFIDTNQYI